MNSFVTNKKNGNDINYKKVKSNLGFIPRLFIKPELLNLKQ